MYRRGVVTMARLALKDVTLHDGTRLPAGTLVAVNVYPFHHDTAILADADTFDPFRYARMRSVAGHSLRHQFTSTSPEYIPFGHGPRAWCIHVVSAASTATYAVQLLMP